MTPTTYTIGTGLAGITGIIITSDTLSPDQTWTLVGILGAVLAGVAKAIHWFCNRLVAQLDEQSKLQMAALNRNTDAAVANTSELRRVAEELRDLPERVVDEIIKRREKP